MNVELVTYTQNPEETIEKAARICYNSKPGDYEKRKKFLSGLIKSGHTSTIEHASATFKISEVSRALTHELVRHRLFSFSQRSQRFCLEDNTGYVVPSTFEKNLQLRAKYIQMMSNIQDLYKEFVDSGMPKEDARYILPNACFTEIYVSGNFREWRHFLELRLSPRAQWEIRELARIILKLLYSIAPIIFGDLMDSLNRKEDN